MGFDFFKQPDQMDCGPTCLRMVAKHFGRNYKIQTLRQLCEINKEGVSLLGISDAAEKIGFKSLGVKLGAKQLKEAELPCILHWRQNHFVVLYKIKKDRFYLINTIKKALHDWYEQKQKSYEAWAKVYPVQLDEKEYVKLDKQSTWCEMAEIKTTPTFLLNGYRLLESYE